MARGIALHIGLNSVDADHYAGWSGPLNACEADAKDMAAITESRGYKATTMLTKNATRKRVLAALHAAATELSAGDSFVLSYSGHGGQLPDANGDEDDAQDETWCLFDGELVDDELDRAFTKFKKGVHVTLFSDSCHSGTVSRAPYYGALANAGLKTQHDDPSGTSDPVMYRAMPSAVALRTYEANRAFYDGIQKEAKPVALHEAQATILLISGCQDNQLSSDGDFNGLFTGMLRKVWNGGKFKGNYKTFHKKILALMPPDQSPNLYLTGLRDAAFEKQTPFTIG